MTKKQIGGLVAAVGLFIVTGVASVLSNAKADNIAGQLEADNNLSPNYDYVAAINIAGTIDEQTETSIFEAEQSYKHDDIMTYIDELMDDYNNKGIMLYLDTPGGTVYESDELYLKLMEYKEVTNRPVWGYISHMAASGGYYIAMSADELFANRNSITGSIGVIISGVDMTGLYEKLGIKYYSATSGEYKDSSVINDDQLAILQSMVDESYEQFVDVVEEGRNMSEEDVKKLADGRIYSAGQALENGLIDEIASFEDVQNKMLEETGAVEMYVPDFSGDVLTSLFAGVDKVVPKSEAQVLEELKDSDKSGRLMYYAEQLH